MMPIRILHILGTAQPEGTSIARIVGTVARGLDPKLYCIHAWFLAGNGPLVGALEQAGVQARSLDWWRGIRDPVGAWRFWRNLRTQQFAIVHLHFGGRSVCWLARAATKAKMIRHVHGSIIEPRGLAPVYFSARSTDAVVVVSQAMASQVVDGPARVIYAGVDVPQTGLPTPRHRTTSQLVIGTARRLIRYKGIEYLLEAAAILHSEFPGLRVEIAGIGPERENLVQRAADLGIAGSVEFLGWVNDLNHVLPRWDVFVIPSIEEGFGIAALEAMAAGLPVIASSVGGLPEIIEDGKTGWLVPPRDAEALASRLRMLLINPELRYNLGAAAYARARDHFSAAQMTENFAQLYDELLDGAGT